MYVSNVVEIIIPINVAKKREEPPVCANCQGNHPSNYKGCEVYKKLQQARDNTPLKIADNNTRINQTLPSYWPKLRNQDQAVDSNHPQQNQTYSEAVQRNTTSIPPNTDTNNTQISDILQTFMVEIKNLLKDIIMNQQFQLFNGVIQTIMSTLTNNK